MHCTYEKNEMQLILNPVDEKWAADQDDLINSKDAWMRGHRGRRSNQCHRCNALLKGGFIVLIGLAGTLAILTAMTMFCPDMVLLLKRQNMDDGNNQNQDEWHRDRVWILAVCIAGISKCFPKKLITGILFVLASSFIATLCCCREMFKRPCCFPCFLLAWCGCLGLSSFM